MADEWTTDTRLQIGIVLATMERIDSHGRPWIRMSDGRRAKAQCVNTLTLSTLQKAAESQASIVLGIQEPPAVPIILGILATEIRNEDAASPEARIDGELIQLTGRETIELRCGKASITLTKAGKVIIRGAYVSSRSSGVNRIKGGSVQIN